VEISSHYFYCIKVSALVRAIGAVGDDRVSALAQAARATPACRHWLGRQGPPEVTVVDGVAHQET
jgi:hypothetical protein